MYHEIIVSDYGTWVDDGWDGAGYIEDNDFMVLTDESCVRTSLFIADYNDHKLLSVEARDSNEAFWAKAEELLASKPKEFAKRSFDEYLK